jgi:two-component system, NarL family, sensor histidine kinase DesK
MMRLLPPDKDLGWTPYVWLIWLGIFFLQPIQDRAGWKEWLATGLGVSAFLALYFATYWVRDDRRLWSLWIIAAMAALGVGFGPSNVGGVVFIVYAATLVPFAADSWLAAKVIVALVAVAALEAVLLHLGAWFLAVGTVLPVALGSVNIHFAQRNRANRQLRMAQDEIEHLARVAERERIARDLHDVLGHTLSVVILKSELASKLMAHDPERAGNEIRDVEQIAREALAEVRNAIGGYRAGGLEEELARAAATLKTAGVACDCQSVHMSLAPSQETVLALAVREAVTNVVRHAHAKQCRLRLEPVDGNCLLEIQDDGRGGSQSEGNGVRGMRERVEALGGSLRRETGAGTRLTILLPLGAGKRNGAL